MKPAVRKKAMAEQERWASRKTELDAWLRGATTWQRFVDFWAVDWDFGDHTGPDGKAVFDTEWQSFRARAKKGKPTELTFSAECRYEQAGTYRVAAKVTDVFGNDGIATVDVTVR